MYKCHSQGKVAVKLPSDFVVAQQQHEDFDAIQLIVSDDFFYNVCN